jgi:hypothetical protein
MDQNGLVVPIHLLGIDEFTIVFGFIYEGNKEYGTITNFDSIVFNGQEVGRGKSATDFDSFEVFYNSIDRTTTIHAEVFAKAKKNKPRRLKVTTSFAK